MNDIQQDVKEFHSLHPNRKFAILGIIVFVFIVSVVIGSYFARNNQTTNQEAVEQDLGNKTALSMTSDVTTLGVGETANVAVILDNAPVQAVDVVINYDPTVVELSNIVNGTVYPDIIRQEVGDGQLIVSAAVDPSDPSSLATGDLFTFTVQGVAAGDATLSFDPDLTITAKSGVNTLGVANDFALSVQ